MIDEPVARQLGNLFERARFFEKVSRAGDYGEFAVAGYRCLCASVQFQDHLVASPTISKVGAPTFVSERPARSGRPPRDTTALTFARGSVAATSAAPAPVLAPK